MYDILDLNNKKVGELKDIAEKLNLSKFDKLKKQELVYKILDEQAINPPKEEKRETVKVEKKPAHNRPAKKKPENKGDFSKPEEKTKETKDWTGTTQGERTYEEMLSIEPDYIYYDTTGSQREMDSIDEYMRYWYEVLDTNSNGEIDDMEGMDCGGKVHDSIIEWLEE